jgi:RNA polymerase sigma factor (TIGR02999 family)
VDEITRALQAVQDKEHGAPEKFLDLVYGELRQLAAAKMAREAPGHTLQPTALVHEAWLRLGGDAQPAWHNRSHFFGAAAEAMRRILIERARRRQAARHGGGQARLNVDEIEIADESRDDIQILAVNDALERLAAVDAKMAELVKLRYFVGLTLEECAQTMEISEVTARRWWAYAKSWLFREIRS